MVLTKNEKSAKKRRNFLLLLPFYLLPIAYCLPPVFFC